MNGKNKVKVVSGNSLIEIASFDGTIPINRGVTVINDIIYINAGGKILSIGDKYRKSGAINNVFTLNFILLPYSHLALKALVAQLSKIQ